MDDVLTRLNAALEGRYTVLEEIGRGGMAVVFLAEDLKHRRKVVLKVLRSELAAILGAERFLKEIEVTANLQHPNILPLYDSGEADGFLYYVMPVVEGESLRERLDREHQLPVEDVVEIARSVAVALDYAHRHGVVHRDVKPSNILLHEGQAMVADFGIALAMRKAGGDARLTETGLSVGTPHYMSPEQAAGDRELDARSDIYSLGATAYEMLVGEPPHVAKTPQAVVAKILMDTPAPIRRARDLVPENVEAAVAKALARSPADRFSSGAEFAAALTNPAFTLPTLAAAGGLRRSETRARAWGRLGPVLAAVAVAAVGILLWAWLRPQEPPAVARYSLALLPGQEFVDRQYPGFDVGPGAAAIVYTGPGEGGTHRLWVKEKGQLSARPLPGTEGAEVPALSPDGREVAFQAGGQLKKVPIQGGPAVTLADSVVGGKWLDDGTLVYVASHWRLRRIPGSGGAWEELWPEHPAELGASYPAPLPGAKGILFTLCDGNCATVMEVWALDLPSGQAHRLLEGALRAWYLDSGHLVFLRSDGAVFAQPFDPKGMKVTGAAVPLLEGVKIDQNIYTDMALASDGTLLVLLGSQGQQWSPGDREMVWVNRNGEVRQVDPGWVFTSTFNMGWALSPDGTRLALGIRTDEGDNIWVKELDDGPLLRLTYHPEWDARPVWSSDGRFIHFSSTRRQPIGRYIQRADGAGEALPLVLSESSVQQAEISPDGTWVVARIGGAAGLTGDRHIVGYRLDQDTTEVPLLVSDYDHVSPRLSRDGRWLAYASQESGQWEVYVRPFPDVAAGRWMVSRGGGFGPQWARSGRELFYISAGREMMAATVEAGETFRVTERRSLFSLPSGVAVEPLGMDFDLTPDDQRFIMMRTLESGEASGPPPMVLVENWGEEVKEKMRAQRR
jgi:eukaryotic-like serine/threonine-protein kinase